jgi:Ca2+-transporting ATPase
LKGTNAQGVFDWAYILDFGHDIDGHELTKFFTAFVFVQFWNMLNVKSFMSNHTIFHNIKGSLVFFVMWILIFVGQLLISMFGGDLFKIVNLSLSEVLYIVAYTSVVAIVGQLYYAMTKSK